MTKKNMRTELTYAVDAMARYNGELEAAHARVADYYAQGGLSSEYFTHVAAYMYDIHAINAGCGTYIAPRLRRSIIKAMRKKMPRVHTEISNWRLNYNCMFQEAAHARKIGRIEWARNNLLSARSIRQLHL